MYARKVSTPTPLIRLRMRRRRLARDFQSLWGRRRLACRALARALSSPTLAGEFLDLRELAPLLAGGPLEATLDRLLDAVRAHATRGELSDDVAVLLLEHTAGDQEFLPLAGEHDWRTSLPR